MKIAVYAMAKNEVAHVTRFVETTKEADVVIVTDTGSNDGTQDALRDHGVQVRDARIIPWRFDHGTNAALFNVPDDVDVCVKLDLDEIIHMTDGSSWREEIERVWVKGTNQLKYWYTWNWIKLGEVPGVRFQTGHIHARSGFHWRHPGHSALTCMSKIKPVTTDKLEIHHYMVRKGRPNYINLLELGVRECRNPRTLYYLGREYYYQGRPRDSIQTLTEYLQHPSATWASERADAMRLLGINYINLNDSTNALSWLIQATSVFPDCRELWFELGRFFHRQKDWLGATWALRKCLDITERKPDWIGNLKDAWGDQPNKLLKETEQHIA